ncbi:ester cyclase [Arthrobacter sp. ISL-30]|uniref:ester cyclase n=1 Tax=Arthrobacter sp. ISL-30 TaxID=2819109 RepID=UPI001BE89BB2|nr:nuclear transport factor 2 family protein [Arthrobacter sp. ISL-30]MBT2514906.1 nuclear transport factor 2 family protein [Arthrobacter sp. ISL-30]
MFIRRLVAILLTTQSYETSSPGQAGPTDSRQALEAQAQAINAHDAGAFASFYADDAVVVDPQYPEPLRGRAAIEQDAGVFVKAFPDLQFSLTSILVDGQMVAGEGTIAGTNNGPLPLPTGEEIPATGRRLEFPMAFFSRLDEAGKIVEERRYYDLANQQTQLGLA